MGRGQQGRHNPRASVVSTNLRHKPGLCLGMTTQTRCNFSWHKVRVSPEFMAPAQIRKRWVTVGDISSGEYIHVLEGLRYQLVYNARNKVRALLGD